VAFDKSLAIAESRIRRMIFNLKLDLPEDLFDAQFPEDDFAKRLRELAILELVRVKRIHEHEAKSILGIERYELVERMKAAGIAPTEDVFAEIKGELSKAIDLRRGRNKAKKPRG
jgi:hypothetical protein